MKKLNIYGFFGAETLRESTPASRVATLPIEAQRQGNFNSSINGSGVPVTVYDPATTRLDPANAGRFIRTPFAGNVIPSSRFDPVAVNVLKLLPVPTSEAGAAGQLRPRRAAQHRGERTLRRPL